MDTIQAPLVSAGGDRCATCASPLAPDQRYCLACGERRGEPRLAFMDGRTPMQAAAAPGPVAPPPPGRWRMGPGGTLVAGVATLLLALGVGVLIGEGGGDNNSPKAAASQPVQVVTVAGAGGAAAGTTTPTDAATTAAATTAKGAKKAKGSDAAAASVAAGSGTVKSKKGAKPPGKVVKVGQKGHGRGYKNGKFTGDFFGP